MKFFRRIMMLCFVSVFCLMTMSHVNAVNYEGFGGSVDVTYRVVSPTYKKTDSYDWAVVNWNYSDRSSHTMWFKVVDSDGRRKGSSLYEYKESHGFSTSNTYENANYRLYAGRENWWDPWTYVSGTWAP